MLGKLNSALNAAIVSPLSEIIAEVSDQIGQSDKKPNVHCTLKTETKHCVSQLLSYNAEAETEAKRWQNIFP